METIDIIICLFLNYTFIIALLIILSKDAKKHDIYLSKNLKILFLLSFTAPFIIIWYLFKRRGAEEGVQENVQEIKTINKRKDIELTDKWICNNCGNENDIYLLNCEKCNKRFGKDRKKIQ